MAGPRSEWERDRDPVSVDCVRMAHLQANAAHYVPRVEQRAEVARELRAIFNAPSREEADRLLRLTL